MTVGHVERHGGDPGELNHLVQPVGKMGKLPDRAGGKDEGHQHHAGADQADEILQRAGMMMGVVGMRSACPTLFDARRHRDVGWRLRIEQLAHEQHQHGAGQREQRNQPDEVEKIHGFPTT